MPWRVWCRSSDRHPDLLPDQEDEVRPDYLGGNYTPDVIPKCKTASENQNGEMNFLFTCLCRKRMSEDPFQSGLASICRSRSPFFFLSHLPRGDTFVTFYTP